MCECLSRSDLQTNSDLGPGALTLNPSVLQLVVFVSLQEASGVIHTPDSPR